MHIYLYVKRHRKTGLLYFGKTIRTDPYRYKGSGSYWTNHIRKHGRDLIETIKIWKFEDQERCTKFALRFSSMHNIVTSVKWANQQPENGLGGAPKGRKLPKRKPISDQTRLKHIINANSRPQEFYDKIGLKHRGKILSEETKDKMRKSMLGSKNPMALGWIISYEDGKSFRIESLKSWCRENNISNYTTLHWNAKHKTSKYHNGLRADYV